MEIQQFLALFGKALFMDRVEACLADMPQVGIVRIHPSVNDLGHRLLSFEPDMLIIDLHAPQLHFVVPFLRERPEIPILGLDLAENRAIMLTGCLYFAPTAEDLLAIVECCLRGDRKDPARSLTTSAMAFSKMQTF